MSARSTSDWVVVKFGGTSVSTLVNWRNIALIVKRRLESGSRVLVVHSAPTGTFVRELRNNLTLNQGVPWPRWSADSKSIGVPATDGNGRQGIFRVDAESGQATPLALSAPGESLRGPAFSPDGTKLLYTRVRPRSGAGPEQRVSSRATRSNSAGGTPATASTISGV